MGRFGATSLLIAALIVGGMFEVAKRLQWIGARPSDELAGIGRVHTAAPRPKMRHFREVPTRGIPGRLVHGTRPMRAVPLAQRGIMIPPTQGQFDSTTPRADASHKIAQAKKNAADKDAEKKCKPRPKDGEELPADLARSVKPEPIKPLTLATLTAKTRESYKHKDGKPDVAGIKQPKKEPTAKETEELPFCEEEENKVAEKKAEPVEEKSEEKKPDESISAGAAVVAGPAPTVGNPTSVVAGLEDWKARIIDQTNYKEAFKETVRLIELAQSGELNSGVFYAVVELLIKDNRPEWKELGVLAAGRTPSAQSFQVLIDVMKHEGFGSKLRQRSEAEINVYEQPSYLWVLESVMRSSEDAFAVVWATKQLEDSASRFLTAKYTRPANGGTPAKNPYVTQFNRFVVVLQDLTKTKGSHETTDQAKTTLQKLQDLIKAVS